MTTLRFEITYNEDAITILVHIDATPNQDSMQRSHTFEGILKRQSISYDTQQDALRIFVHTTGEVEKVMETFRLFEKQDKIKESKLNTHKNIASLLEEKLKSIFPPPEAQVGVKYAQ
jgi:hypothetical protein